MRIDWYTKTVLTLVAVLLAMVALKPMFQPESVNAQMTVAGPPPYAYLAPQAGDATADGGKHFIDLRNGKLWMCDFKGCTVDGRYPLEKTR